MVSWCGCEMHDPRAGRSASPRRVAGIGEGLGGEWVQQMGLTCVTVMLKGRLVLLNHLTPGCTQLVANLTELN